MELVTSTARVQVSSWAVATLAVIRPTVRPSPATGGLVRGIAPLGVTVAGLAGIALTVRLVPDAAVSRASGALLVALGVPMLVSVTACSTAAA